MPHARRNQACWSEVCLYVCIVAALLGACSSHSAHNTSSSSTPAFSLPVGKTLAAIGVKAQGKNGTGAEDAAWRDRRVGFGLTNLLAESFYETGKFRLVEEKDLPQRQLIEEMVDLFWSASRSEPSDPELVGIGARLEADLLAYGKVGYSRSSGQRIQVGPVGRYQQELRVSVEVCLFEVASQHTLCRAAGGSAQQTGMGVVYEFRNDRPDFEKNAIGRATKQAVTSAVQALMASMRFSP